MLNIPEKIYDYKLRDHLYRQLNENKIKGECTIEIELLIKILRVQLEENKENEIFPFIDKLSFSNTELDVLSQYMKSNNLEIRAYSKDIYSKKNKTRFKLDIAKSASDDYLSLYIETSRPIFLLRSVVVRAYRQLKSKEFINEVCQALLKKFYPSWMKRICIEMRRLYSKDDLFPIYEFISEQLVLFDNLHRNDERDCLDAIKELGYMDNIELHKKKALSFEAELDYLYTQKEPNVIYPNNVDIIQNAYNEIYKVKGYFKEEYERIKMKLMKEQQQFINELQQCAPTFKYELPSEFVSDVNSYIDSISIKSSIDVVNQLRQIPFVSKTTIEKCCSNRVEQSIIYSMFGGANIGSKGQIIGTATPEDAVRIDVYRTIRLKFNFIVNSLLYRSTQVYKELDETLLGNILFENCKTQYIEVSHVQLWISSFILALKGDYIAAVHILIPQIERYLVNKAESIYGNLSALQNESHQDEAGLSKALELLKEDFKEDLYNDLRYFLTMGADINMRNNVAHGLWTPEEIYRNAPYCIWLAVKMYFCEDEIFNK